MLAQISEVAHPPQRVDKWTYSYQKCNNEFKNIDRHVYENILHDYKMLKHHRMIRGYVPWTYYSHNIIKIPRRRR